MNNAHTTINTIQTNFIKHKEKFGIFNIQNIKSNKKLIKKRLKQIKKHHLYNTYKHLLPEKIDINNIKYGIVIENTDLKTFPTTDKTDKNFDKLEETEVKITEPIIILAESKDKYWSFVFGYNFIGWIQTKNIAFSSQEDFIKYNNFDTNNFIITLDTITKIYNKEIAMGTKFKINAENNKYYYINFPIKNKNNSLEYKIIQIDKNLNFNKGYLSYSTENLIKQAEKYIGMKYKWGGRVNGVDCSGFLNNIFNVFGIYLPRNSSQINKTFVKKNKNIKKAKIGDLIYFPGHIMLYLGNNEILHSIAVYYQEGTKYSPMIVQKNNLTNIFRANQKTFLENITNIGSPIKID